VAAGDEVLLVGVLVALLVAELLVRAEVAFRGR
jgi:hypothetical protein